MPKKGPFVGIINHSSLFDIPALTIAFKHRAATMVKHSLFSVPVLGWWLNAVDMFPVKRNESDDESFKWALSQLKKGRVVVMAPEGTRKYDPGNPPRVRTGFVRLAQEADCPVVPMAIAGTREVLPPGAKFPRFVKVTVNVGKEIRFKKVNVNLKNRDKLQEQATQGMNAIYQLKDELLTKYN